MSNNEQSSSPTAGAMASAEDKSSESKYGSATGTSFTPTTGRSGAIMEYGQRVGDAASMAREYLTPASVGELTEEAKNYTRQNPGSALLLSAAIGLALGLVLPRTGRSWSEPDVSIEEEPLYAPAVVTPQSDLMVANEYIISKPSGLSDSESFDAQLQSLNSIAGLRLVNDDQRKDNKVVLLSDTELNDLKTRVPGLIIEPNIFFKFGVHMLVQDFIALRACSDTRTIRVRVVDGTNKRPLSDVPVYLVTDGLPGQYSGYHSVTGADGVCNFEVARSRQKFEDVIVDDRAGYWTRRLGTVKLNSGLTTIELNPLPCKKSALYDWGAQFAGMSDGLPQGEGVTIGIIDSGVSNHPSLNLAGGHNCVLEETFDRWDEDLIGHGTHCAGVLAATIAQGSGIKGYVPRARVFSYKTVPKNETRPRYDAIVEAIKRAVKDRCDIINMSFGSSIPGVYAALSTSLTEAYENGIFCVAAAGNEAGDLHYPAVFSWVMGVGAFGRLQGYPSDSLHTAFESNRLSQDGKYYLANFSNRGRNLDFCAPGIAVVSTVPGGGYLAMDGTSMACPQVAGIAALTLAAHPEILNAKRNAARVNALVHLLKSRAEPLGFGPRFEGNGGLKIGSLLGA